MRKVPIGIDATGMRRERDTTGFIDVPADKYWGASTQRALKASSESGDRIPERFFRCYGHVKKAVALMNAQVGRLPLWKTEAIVQAADEMMAGRFADQFPLPVWQIGAGGDQDTNVNEVLANRASQLLGGAIGLREPVDPVRDVNMGLVAGGTFKAAMYIATVIEIETVLVLRCSALARAIERNPRKLPDHGRRLRTALSRLDDADGSLHEIGADLADGGIAAEDWQVVVAFIAAATGRPFVAAPDGFSDRESLDAMVAAMAASRGLAIVLMDIAEDAYIQGNAQAAVIAGLCRHVIGQDQIVTAAVAQGNAAWLMARPLIVALVLNSLHSLGEGCETMRRIVSRAAKLKH